tara:strand:- start:140 stop:1120 length:981 start_codon:yes stop_codon:yes gene_type:complete
MSKILVTGGSGFIGSHFVDIALKNNDFVINLDKQTYASNKRAIKQKNYHEIKGNICNFNLIKKILKKYEPDYIINFAAETHVDNSIRNPKVFFKTNIDGVINIIENLKNNKKFKKFIQVSTDEVFGSLKLKDKPFTKFSPYNPQSPYAASKAASDHIIKSYSKTYGLEFIITHCTNNFGPRQHNEKLIPLVLNRAINNQLIPIYGNGKNIRDWIYVEDHTKILYKILKNKKFTKDTYLIGSNNEISNIVLVKQLLNILETQHKKKNLNQLINYVTDRPNHDFRYSINTDFVMKTLKFKFTDFQKSLNKTVDYYLENNKRNSKFFKY